MPDVLIRGAKIPKSCAVCKIRSYNAYCPLNETIKFMYDPTNRGFDFCTGTHPKCPLHELPEHGDLIDRDAFRAENEYYLNREFINPKYEDTLDDLLKDAPVVIPSNKEV